ERLPERATRDVLVRDVDVTRVAREREDPLAARVTERRRGTRLALRARGRLPLARDDLERHVEPRLLVAREPHLPHPARAERPQRPVAAEDELPCDCGGSHPAQYFA